MELVSVSEAQWQDESWWKSLVACRRASAKALLDVLTARKSGPELAVAETMLESFSNCGANDFAASPELVAEAQSLAAQGWAGTAAAALLIPAWQAGFLGGLRSAPAWLNPYLTTYCFATPRMLTAAGQVEGSARAFLLGLENVLAVVEANRGSVLAQELVQRFQASEDRPFLALAERLYGEIRVRRGRLVSVLGRGAKQVEIPAFDRTGRALRIGVVAQQLDESPAVLTLLPLLERLPGSRFALTVFVTNLRDSAIERQLKDRGALITEMKGDPDELAQSLRDAALDVVVFVVDGRWLRNPVAELALRRAAPLQIVHDGTGFPTGLAESDLFIASPLAASMAGLVERPALVSEGGFAAIGELASGQPEEAWTRATIGVSEDAKVYGYIGDLTNIRPEVMELWAEILAQVPESHLVIVAPPVPGIRVDRFCANFCARLAAHGVSGTRVGVFGDVILRTADERKACMGALDVLLVADPIETGEIACAALAAGRPVVALGHQPGASAAILRAAGLDELIASDRESYRQLAARLIQDITWRRSVTERIEHAAPAALARYDSFAISEAFGGLVEAAYDQVAVSRKRFQSQRAVFTAEMPANVAAKLEEAALLVEIGALTDAENRLRSLLRAPTETAQARRALAAVLGRQENHAEATDLLVSVVELVPADASAWMELGAAARKAGRNNLAVQALRTGVQFDPKRVESWKLLAEFAEELGNTELQAEIEGVLRELGASVSDRVTSELDAKLAAIRTL